MIRRLIRLFALQIKIIAYALSVIIITDITVTLKTSAWILMSVKIMCVALRSVNNKVVIISINFSACVRVVAYWYIRTNIVTPQSHSRDQKKSKTLLKKSPKMFTMF